MLRLSPLPIMVWAANRCIYRRAELVMPVDLDLDLLELYGSMFGTMELQKLMLL